LAATSDKSSKTSSNTSLNSCVSRRSWSIETRVFHIIDASEIELRPAEVPIKPISTIPITAVMPV
jgi:hypothetical protein